VNALDSENATLSSELQKLSDSLASAQRENEDHSRTISRLLRTHDANSALDVGDRLGEARMEVQALEYSVRELQQERAEMGEQLKNLQESCDFYQRSADENRKQFEEENASLRKENRMLKLEIESACDCVPDSDRPLDGGAIELESVKKLNIGLSGAKQELEREIEKMQSEVGCLKKSKGELEKEVRRLEKELEEAKNGLRRAMAESEENRKEIAELQFVGSTVNEEKQALVDEIRALKVRIEKQTIEMDVLRESASSRSHRSSELESQFAALENANAQLSSELSAATAALEERNAQILQLEATVKDCEDRLNFLRTQSRELQEQLLRSEAQREALEDVSRENAGLRSKLEKLESEFGHVSAVNAEIGSTQRTSETHLGELKAEVAHLRDENVALKADMEKQRETADALIGELERNLREARQGSPVRTIQIDKSILLKKVEPGSADDEKQKLIRHIEYLDMELANERAEKGVFLREMENLTSQKAKLEAEVKDLKVERALTDLKKEKDTE
jgi:chromosome segregation ATPase